MTAKRQFAGYRVRAQHLGDFVYLQRDGKGFCWNEYPPFPSERALCQLRMINAKIFPYREGDFEDRSAVYDIKIVAVFTTKVKK